MLHTRQFQALRSAVPPQQGAQHRCIPHAVSDSKRGKHVATCQVDSSGQLWDLQRSWLSAAVMGAMSLSMLLQPAPAASEEMSIAFPASADREIRQAQQTMVESWAYVQALYFDPFLSHTDWAQELQDSLAASFKASSAAEVAGVTNQLLAKLGDPYTRLLQGDDATALEAQEEGKIVATGLGLQQVLLVPQDSPAAATAAAAAAPALATAPADAAALELSSSSSSSGAAPDAAAAAAAAGQEAMLVSFVVDDSAAAAAGVTQGDLLLAVDGQPVAGQELRQVYKLLSKEADVTMLRQQPGSSSSTASGSIQLMTQLTDSTATTSAPSRGSRSEAVLAAAVAVGYSPDPYTVHLKPTPLEFAPVQFGAIDVDKAVARAAAENQDSADAVSASSTSNSSGVAAGSSTSSSSSSGNGAGLPDVGYLKLLSFSATAPQEVAQALVDMQYEAAEEHGGHGLAGIIVDLRDNPGGIVEAGVSIAQDFLQEGQVLCIALDRSGQEERVVLPTAHTLTQLPLVVLVNRSTASTSELLAGALHDELSAPLVGTTTYGKGRSQRVVQLADGTSTLLVSTLKYFTPQHTEIDQVGLKPDLVCDPPEVVGGKWSGGRVDGKEQGGLSLLDDPCVKLAAEKLAGRML